MISPCFDPVFEVVPPAPGCIQPGHKGCNRCIVGGGQVVPPTPSVAYNRAQGVQPTYVQELQELISTVVGVVSYSLTFGVFREIGGVGVFEVVCSCDFGKLRKYHATPATPATCNLRRGDR